jgi:hypothetical protein
MVMTITWYGSQSEVEGCRFGALAILWPLLRLEDAGCHAIVAVPWDEFRPLFDQ